MLITAQYVGEKWVRVYFVRRKQYFLSHCQEFICNQNVYWEIVTVKNVNQCILPGMKYMEF